MNDWAIKHRPKKLTDIVGQEVNTTILQRLVNANQLYGAMIFYGRSGCGKTTTARCLALEMNAELVEIDAAGNSSADDARQIAEIAQKFALTGQHKIIIIDEAHALSKQAWQVMLKAIEEPAPRTHWIFCTTEYQALPNTIKGRCHMFKYYALPYETLSALTDAVLKTEGINTLPNTVKHEIIKESKGQPRDLLKLLQITAENGLDTLEKYFKFLQKPDTRGMVTFIEGVIESKPGHALKVLKEIKANDLVEWKRRLEEMIYDIVEDAYGLDGLQGYPEAMQKKMKALSKNEIRKFGLLLDKLLWVSEAKDAMRQLTVIATMGV